MNQIDGISCVWQGLYLGAKSVSEISIFTNAIFLFNVMIDVLRSTILLNVLQKCLQFLYGYLITGKAQLKLNKYFLIMS